MDVALVRRTKLSNCRSPAARGVDGERLCRLLKLADAWKADQVDGRPPVAPQPVRAKVEMARGGGRCHWDRGRKMEAMSSAMSRRLLNPRMGVRVHNSVA